MKLSNTLLGLAVGLFVSSASALSLGEAHGRVLLGKPLDLVFDIHTDPGTELNLACVRASVQAGETFIDNSRLRITALPVLAGRAPSVRVLSSAVVMEPILSLRLSVGCLGTVVRNYDFFADVPAALVASKRPLVIAPAAAAEPFAPEKAQAAEPSAQVVQTSKTAQPAKLPKQSKPPQSPQPPKSPKSPTPPKQQLEIGSAQAAAPLGERAPAALHKSRLTVEPLGDWLAQSTLAPLRLSPQLQQEPSEKSSQQRTQAAALWQLLNISAQDVQQTQLRLQQLQAEIDAARASSATMQTTVSALQKRVDTLDVQRFPVALLYSLLALLVLICAALAWLWQRMRSYKPVQRFDSDWSHSEALRDKERASAASIDSESLTAPAPLPAAAPAPTAAAQPATAPLSLAKSAALVPPDAPMPVPADAAVAAQQQATHAELAPATVGAVRMLHPEELFDLQQQAEFFISVGEHEQAIEVMKQHIEENRTASPLMYLELLLLYRSLSRRTDFSDLRAQFQQHFNALVPEFSAFQGGGRRTLLDYPDVAASIEAVWSDSAVLALLESYIFCQHNGQKTVVEPFELPAYDDLLLLYAIASTIPAETRGAPPPRQRTMPHTVAEPAQSPPLEPLNLPEQDLLSPAALPALDEVDFDLAPFLDAALLAPLPVAQSEASLALEAAQAAPALGNLIEYDAHQLSNRAALASAPVPAPAPQPRATQSAWTLDLDLDLDLSDPNALELADLPLLTESAIPALAVTPPPAPGASIGFGAVSDRFEARFDLEDDKGKPMDF